MNAFGCEFSGETRRKSQILVKVCNFKSGGMSGRWLHDVVEQGLDKFVDIKFGEVLVRLAETNEFDR